LHDRLPLAESIALLHENLFHAPAATRADVHLILSIWAVRGTDLKSIEVDPDRLSGRPAIRGTRVSAELVAGLARTEAGRRTLRIDYGITAHQMDEALTWWQAVEKLTAAA